MNEKDKSYETDDDVNEPEELSDEDLEEVAGGWDGDPTTPPPGGGG